MKRTAASIFRFWVPLAAQWLMMASEGPFLAALIARMVDPEYNLAAYGVAFAFAILIESPVIMLMSASTALVEDSATYRKLRNFMYGLNAIATALLLILLFPPAYGLLTSQSWHSPSPSLNSPTARCGCSCPGRSPSGTDAFSRASSSVPGAPASWRSAPYCGSWPWGSPP